MCYCISYIIYIIIQKIYSRYIYFFTKYIQYIDYYRCNYVCIHILKSLEGNLCSMRKVKGLMKATERWCKRLLTGLPCARSLEAFSGTCRKHQRSYPILGLEINQIHYDWSAPFLISVISITVIDIAILFGGSSFKLHGPWVESPWQGITVVMALVVTIYWNDHSR